MRSSRRSITQKKPYRHSSINKKNHKKSKGSLGWYDDNNNITRLRLNDLNEVLRENKARRAEGKGSWKVVPKDSCEVYRDRRKRGALNRRKQQSNDDASEDTECQTDNADKTKRREPAKKTQRKKVPSRKYNQKTRNRKRSDASSLSSYSNYTTSSLTTSCSTISEMEYD